MARSLYLLSAGRPSARRTSIDLNNDGQMISDNGTSGKSRAIDTKTTYGKRGFEDDVLTIRLLDLDEALE